jgi:hypothetical protein
MVNDGALLIPVTVMVNVCAADVSTPPFAVPPSSTATSVIVVVPTAPGPGVAARERVPHEAGPPLGDQLSTAE